jgi:hypothetical protein
MGNFAVYLPNHIRVMVIDILALDRCNLAIRHPRAWNSRSTEESLRLNGTADNNGRRVQIDIDNPPKVPIVAALCD